MQALQGLCLITTPTIDNQTPGDPPVARPAISFQLQDSNPVDHQLHASSQLLSTSQHSYSNLSPSACACTDHDLHSDEGEYDFCGDLFYDNRGKEIQLRDPLALDLDEEASPESHELLLTVQGTQEEQEAALKMISKALQDVEIDQASLGKSKQEQPSMASRLGKGLLASGSAAIDITGATADCAVQVVEASCLYAGALSLAGAGVNLFIAAVPIAIAAGAKTLRIAKKTTRVTAKIIYRTGCFLSQRKASFQDEEIYATRAQAVVQIAIMLTAYGNRNEILALIKKKLASMNYFTNIIFNS